MLNAQCKWRASELVVQLQHEVTGRNGEGREKEKRQKARKQKSQAGKPTQKRPHGPHSLLWLHPAAQE